MHRKQPKAIALPTTTLNYLHWEIAAFTSEPAENKVAEVTFSA
jgi:hypothetical protein